MTVPTEATPPSATAETPAAFAAWVAPSLTPMHRLARRLAPQADADDVVQDSLTRAWQKRDQYDAARGTSTTWLLAIVADQARAARRAHARHLRVVDADTPVPDAAAPPDTGTDIDLERAIEHLGERQQLAVHLFYFLGLTVDDAAQVMGCSTGTVKSTLFDARSRLRTLLGDER